MGVWVTVAICCQCWAEKTNLTPVTISVDDPVLCTRCDELTIAPVYVRAEWSPPKPKPEWVA